MLSHNTKRFFIILLVSLQVFSSVFFVPGIEDYGGSLFRVVLIIISLYFLSYSGFNSTNIVVKRSIYVCLLLISYMIASLFISYDFRSGFQHISYVFNLVLLIYSLDSFVESNDDIQFLAKCIIFVGLIVAIFSLYELQTGIHLFDSQLLSVSESSASLSYVSQDTAWFTFSNPNDLGVHLVFCIMISFIILKNKTNIVLYYVYALFLIYLTFEVESRLALLAIIVFMNIQLIYKIQKTSKMIFFTAFLASFVGFALVIFFVIYADRMEFIDVSTFVRLKLILSAVDMASNSLFLGVGVGSFETVMKSDGWASVTYGIVNPHNAMGRIFAENGLIGLLLFGFIVFGPLMMLARVRQPSQIGRFVAAFVTALPLLLSVGSDPLSASTLQLAIAVCWVGCRLAISNPLDLHRTLIISERSSGSRYNSKALRISEHEYSGFKG